MIIVVKVFHISYSVMRKFPGTQPVQKFMLTQTLRVKWTCNTYTVNLIFPILHNLDFSDVWTSWFYCYNHHHDSVAFLLGKNTSVYFSICICNTLSEETAHSSVYHHLSKQFSCIKTAQSSLRWICAVVWTIFSESVYISNITVIVKSKSQPGFSCPLV